MRTLAEFQADGVTTVVVGWETPDNPDFETVELWVKDLSSNASGIVKVSETREPPATLVLEADSNSAKTIIGRTRMRNGQGSDFQASPTVTATINKLEVTGGSLADGSVGDNKLDRVTDPVTIQTADIANLAVNNAKIADLAATKITAGTLAAGVIYAGTINATQVNAGTLNSVNVNAGTYSLISGVNQMTIDGTDGFKQLNTSNNRFTQIVNGEINITQGAAKLSLGIESALALRNLLSFLVTDLTLSSGGQTQITSGRLRLFNAFGSEKVQIGTEASSGDGAIWINGTKVLGPQEAALLDPTGTADATYSANEQAILNDYVARMSALLARLRSLGLIDT
jgi:hypothetical protein